MPKLLIFAPCEKVIVAQNNTISLITILERLTVQIPKDKPAPPDTVFPMKWSILTLWQRQEGDEGREFEEKCELLSGEGKSLISASIRFKFVGEAHSRVIMEIVGFPLQLGQCEIKMYLRDTDATSEWREVADYPVRLQVEPA
jgi:hypothetical protein